MNKWNKLLDILNHLFGLGRVKKSNVRKIKQYFDEKKNHHVFLLEYRCELDTNPKKTQHEKHKKRRSDQYQVGKLLKDLVINDPPSRNQQNPVIK